MFISWRKLSTQLISSLLCSSLIFAAPVSQPKTLDKARSQFIKAEKALERNDEQTYRKLAAKLQDYPLYPYLEYQYLLQHLDNLKEVQAFLANYQDMPLAGQLRQALLKELSAKKNWSAVILNYQTSRDVAQRCQYLYAKHNLGKLQATKGDIQQLWLVGYTQPNECDPVFAEWLTQGAITNHMIWQRLNLVMQRSNQRLGSYLVKRLSSRLQPLGKLYLQINHNPLLLLQNKTKLVNQPNAYKQDIVVNGIARLANSQPATALKLWETFSNTYHFTQQQEEIITEKLARGFTRKKPIQLNELVDAMKPNSQNLLALEFLIRYAISMEAWQVVLDSIQKLPAKAQTESSWQYWLARSQEQLGNKKIANEIFTALATKRNFYGFLAAAKIHKPFPMHNTKVVIDTTEYDKVSQLPAIARVRELMLLDRNRVAYNEWYHLLRKLDEKQKYIAAQIAYDNSWPYLALRTAAGAKHQDDLELRFPRMYQAYIKKAQKTHKLPPELIYAMIRQESFFHPSAESYAGAKGLMQLMPSTAADMAKKIKLHQPVTKDLYQPALNIRLGTEYVQYLLDRFDQNIVFAVAAYNAGPGRVDHWLPEKNQATDVWVESIPYHETREYVKHVTTYMLIYQYLLGQEPSFHKIYQPILQSTPIK